MLLAAIVAFLAGFIVYASTVTLENTLKIQVEVESFETTQEYKEQSGQQRYSLISSRLPISQKGHVDTGMIVRIGKETGRVEWLAAISEENEIALIIEMENGYFPLPDGVYDAELVLESTTPISFLWN